MVVFFLSFAMKKGNEPTKEYIALLLTYLPPLRGARGIHTIVLSIHLTVFGESCMVLLA